MNVQKLEEDAWTANNLIKKAVLSGESQVQKFYDDAVVFITGGSGFIGKHLIAKLMSSSNIKKVYVLLRQKKGKTISERLNTILKDPLYEYLHNEQPDFVDKIVPIQGDTSELKLGIDEKNWAIIADEVNVIFNAAATINFRENIKLATLTNIRGTREVLNLAKASKELKAIVHVSTAYSNATKTTINNVIKEEFYESPLPPEALIQMAETVNEKKLSAMVEPFFDEWPNSYTFTKAIAEILAKKEAEGLPFCIVRPAIVLSSFQEPKPGWIDIKNAFGPSGLMLGLALGITHTYYVKHNGAMDFVPVDLVNNTCIVAAYDTYKRYTRNERQINIYTVSKSDNPVEWNDFVSILNEERIVDLIPSKSIWYCNAINTRYKFVYLFLSVIFHYIPALIVDGVCVLTNRKPRLFKTYRLADSLISVFMYFLHNFWHFDNNKTQNLYKSLSDTDKIIYNCDTSTIPKREMVYRWIYGIVKYIMRDDFSKNEYALKKQFYFKIATFSILPIYFYAIYKLTFFVVALLYNAIFYITTMFCACVLV